MTAHSLTVTQLAFSPCNTKLLCVSRDRTWSLHTISKTGEGVVTNLLARTDKKTAVHTRLIWSCGWTHDSRYFATASRDKKVVMWGEVEGVGWGQVGEVLTLPDSVTAVAVGGQTCGGGYIVAAGLENGAVHVLAWDKTWREVVVVNSDNNGHHSTVTRLAFQPAVDKFVLASCSTDNSVRIINIQC